MSNLTVRIPSGLKKALEKMSRKQHRSAGMIVRDCLRRYLAVEDFNQLRGRVLPFAEAQGLLTDEDVFKEIS